MPRKRRTRFLILGALITMLFAMVAAPLLAQPGPRGRHHGPHGDGPHFQRMLERLDLTAEQREQVRLLLEEHRAATEPDRDELREREAALRDRMHASQFDEIAIREAAAAVAAVRAELIVARAALHRDLRQLLTPAQVEQLEQMRERREEWRERRGPGGPDFEPRWRGPEGPRGDRP